VWDGLVTVDDILRRLADGYDVDAALERRVLGS
jgi:hypothetical protein